MGFHIYASVGSPGHIVSPSASRHALLFSLLFHAKLSAAEKQLLFFFVF
jgi:hypothetical protein